MTVAPGGVLAAATVTSTWPGGTTTVVGGAAIVVVGGAVAAETGGVGVLLPPLQPSEVTNERERRRCVLRMAFVELPVYQTDRRWGSQVLYGPFWVIFPAVSRVMSQSMGLARLSVLALTVVALVSCGPPTHGMPDAQIVLGPRTGSTCPTPALTYANFGASFFDTYCVACHASTVTGDARNGAPVDHNYDTAAGIRMWIPEIDEVAASGPNATNTAMPFFGTAPSMAERQMLGQFLACGAPD